MTLTPATGRYSRWDRNDGDPELAQGAHWFAGGTDLIPLSRTGVVDVDALVDIKSSNLGTTIERSGDVWTIGALATLSDLADHEGLADAIPAIREAVSQAATLQIRHRATIGGNLLQRPRCSYFRDPEVACWMKGGSDCPAQQGRNEHHALVDEPCVATQPSDLASVLVALDAELTVAEPGGRRRVVPITEFMQRPSEARRALHILEPGELIVSIAFADPATRRSTYRKAMDRAVWQFALVGVAAIVDVDHSGTVRLAKLVASGVDSIPHPLTRSADALVGRELSDESIAEAVHAAPGGLVALSENGYKVTLLRGLVQRALEQLRDS